MTMDNQGKNLKEAIIKTIRFFDFFSFPLTTDDLWRYLPLNCEKSVLAVELNSLVVEGVLEGRDDKYFLKGHEDFFDLADEKKDAAKRKLRRARFVTKVFRFIPWIRMVAVANVMGDNNFRKEGDIDLFIIVRKNRIWLSRLFAVMVTDIMRLRPKENDVKDKICLSFFVTEDALDVSSLLLLGQEPLLKPIERDPYFVYWLSNLIIIYDDGVYSDFIKANTWFAEQLPNWQTQSFDVIRNPLTVFFLLFDTVFGVFEKLARRLQLKIVPEKIRNLEDKGTDVVMNDQVLKFHTNDRRVMYREKMNSIY